MRNQNKAKSSVGPGHYFDGVRNYSIVVDAEIQFFKALIKFKDQFPLSHSVSAAISCLPRFIQRGGQETLDITVEFDVKDPRKGSPYKLFLGTRISPASPNSAAEVTHFLCLANESDLVAKFHSDFDFEPESSEIKPSPHVQIGGRVPPSLNGKYVKKYWHTDANKPRIPALPTCTALLWHWAFLEFQQDEIFAKYLRNSWWKKLIKDAELAIMGPFFEDGNRLLREQTGDGLLSSLYIPFAK